MKFELSPSNRGATDRDMLSDLRRCADDLGQRSVTPQQYRELGKFGERTFAKRFGSWSRALQLAQLEPNKVSSYSESELFENIRDVWMALGRQPQYRDIQRSTSRFSVKVYRTTFGSWSEALREFVLWVNNEDNEESTKDADAAINADEPPSSVRRITRREISDRLRFRILMRDAFCCRSCGASPLKELGVELHVDHIVPWSIGGETIDTNLETKCARCNLGKGNAFSA
jgi:hypothetical protein